MHTRCTHALTTQSYTYIHTRPPTTGQFVDMPGSERLGMDPEVLRLREGVTVNRSLVAFAAVVGDLIRNSNNGSV